MSVLSKEYFHNEEAAFKHLESILWAEGIVCPKCGVIGNAYPLKTRMGVKKCGSCRQQFTVRVGTVFESSHIPLHKWLQATYLLSSSKKGISAHQLHRTLEITYKSAWFMMHRLREAMRVTDIEPKGGNGKIVEADETFIGGKGKQTARGGRKHMSAILSLVERGGNVQSFHITATSNKELRPIFEAQVAKDSTLITDKATWYDPIGGMYEKHETVNHTKKEYARGNVHTNTVEGFFGIFKRGMQGIYQHCSSKHLHRYLAEFDFRYNWHEVSDLERTNKVLVGIVGKRLMYRAKPLLLM